MENLLEIMRYAHSQVMEEDRKQPDHNEDQFESGAEHGAIEGKISAYKDIIKRCAILIDATL